MSEVLIVAKTRMNQGRMCVGAHDLADFRSLRLFRADGSRFADDAAVEVGEVWALKYAPRPNADPPHLEDVFIQPDGKLLRTERDLAALVLERDVVWSSLEELFDGCLAFTASGTGYVPDAGQLPTRSTGYWRPDRDLELRESFGKPRYRWSGGGQLGSIGYVGITEAAAGIPAGSLVRLSLSRRYAPPDQPGGYWLQLSGWFPL